MPAAPLTTFTNAIIHGDCLKVLPQIHAGSVDFILTDPPSSPGIRIARDAASRTTITPPG